MGLEQIPVKEWEGALPAEVEELVGEADRRVQAFREERRLRLFR